jgi:hypothetical protein
MGRNNNGGDSAVLVAGIKTIGGGEFPIKSPGNDRIGDDGGGNDDDDDDDDNDDDDDVVNNLAPNTYNYQLSQTFTLIGQNGQNGQNGNSNSAISGNSDSMKISTVSLISTSNPNITSVIPQNPQQNIISSEPPQGIVHISQQISNSPLQLITKWIFSELPSSYYPIVITLLSFFRSLVRSGKISYQQLTLLIAKPLTHVANIQQALPYCANKSASHLIYHILKEA